jgi:lipopolysaccharide/colanic/teichoic acid biosynthesis glycosyltransferase
MVKRLFDIIASLIGIIILSPFFILISILVVVDSRGGIFYKQVRVGKGLREFKLLKFRTMYSNSDEKGLLTVGMKDSRITRIGYYLRKYKLDELPQLLNVLIGDMSVVGPRPEVPKYVAIYTDEQKKVFVIKPGITDYASIEYANENEILAKATNPEEEYINNIMPAKLKLNMKYISEMSLRTDIGIIFRTISKLFL